MNLFRTGLLGIALIISLFETGSALAAPVFGRYVGVLKHERLNREQLVKLDFVLSKSTAANVNLKAILSLQFGGFESGEYVSYHFDDVQFQLITGALTFDQADQDVTITVSEFKDGKLKGELRSVTGGMIGRLDLKRDTVVTPTKPLIEPLNGRYQGACSGEPTTLQIHTFRSTEDTSRVGNPFAPYQIKGQFANDDDRLCPFSDGRGCVKARFDDGSYDFYSGDLRLSGRPNDLTCRVEGNSLQCGSCRLTRTSSEVNSRLLSVKTLNANIAVTEEATGPNAEAISGTYRGFIYHEYLDTYQQAEINLVTFQGQGESGPTLRISATSTLQFGEADAPERLSYRFEATDYPSPLGVRQFLVARPEADVDAMIRVNSLDKGVIKGEWFSILFGRVGTFVMQKQGMPSLPPGARMMPAPSGEYVQNNLIINIRTRLGRTPINTDNPYFPLEFSGHEWNRRIGLAKVDIEGGSYDFYTGRIGILLKDGDAYVGLIGGHSSLSLRPFMGRFGTILTDFNFEPYTK